MPKNLLLRIITYGAGIIAVMLGIVVMLAYRHYEPVLIQIRPDWPPMQFNTALCFILAGLSLIALNKSEFKIITRILSGLVILISSLTLLEYLSNVDFHIDELFVQSQVSISTSHPGRMAPNAALAFIFVGLNLLVFTFSSYSVTKIKFHFYLSLMIFGLATIGFINLILGFTLYGWGQWIKMAFHTSLGLAVLSIGFITFIYKNKHRVDYIPITPSIVTFILLLITFWGWQGIVKNQNDNMDKLLQIKVESIKAFIGIIMKGKVASFARIGSRWVASKGTPEKEWRSDVLHYIQDQPGYRAIEWVDKDFNIQWVMPDTGNEHIKEFNLMQDSHRRTTIEKVLQTKKLQMTSVIDLIQGGRGILFFDPLYLNNQFDGLMVGVIDTQEMIGYLINKLIRGYGLKIYNEGQILYQSHNDELNFDSEWIKKVKIFVFGQHWEIELWPTDEQIMSSWLSEIFLIGGILIAFLVGFLIKTFHFLKVSADNLNVIRSELSDANERLNGIIEGSSDYIAALDLNLNFIAFNTSYKNEVFRVFKINLERGMNFSVLLERMAPENQEKNMALWRRAFEGHSFTVIESFNDKRFDDLDFEIHYNPICNTKGQLVGASHIATNVSLRVQNEKRIVDSKQELESMVLSLEKQNKELALLEEMMNLLQSSNSFEDMIQPIANYIKKILSSTSGVVYFVDPNDAKVLNENIRWGEPVSQHKTLLKTDCWALLRSKMHKVVLEDDTVRCKHVSSTNEQPSAYVCQPLYVQGELLGLLYMEMNREASINKRLIYLSQILSEQIGLSLYNVNLRDELRLQSTHDTLTGLYNRRFFEEYFKQEILKAERASTIFSIVLLDVDNFKKINDSNGHLAGDKVLQSVAGELTHHCRKSDVLCRWGGEEFLFFFGDASIDAIMLKAESIRQAIESLSIDIGQASQVRVTTSIGVAFYPADGHTLDSLVSRADDALYQAKNSGRNKVVRIT